MLASSRGSWSRYLSSGVVIAEVEWTEEPDCSEASFVDLEKTNTMLVWVPLGR